MKIEPTHAGKPSTINSKNSLGILIALAFFAGTPVWRREELLPIADPKGAIDGSCNKNEAKERTGESSAQTPEH
jgi:hypothetical protein